MKYPMVVDSVSGKVRLDSSIENFKAFPEPPANLVAEKLAEGRAHPEMPTLLKRFVVARHRETGIEMLLPRMHDYDTDGFDIIDDIETAMLLMAKTLCAGNMTVVEADRDAPVPPRRMDA